MLKAFSPATSRRLLQIMIAIFATVPVVVGADGMIFGGSMLGTAAMPVPMDSHTRYLSGILCAIGLSFWSFIPAIENKTREVRLLTILVFFGGLARLWHAITFGREGINVVFPLTMELFITPALCLWQKRISLTQSD
jgi:hypothetical protein